MDTKNIDSDTTEISPHDTTPKWLDWAVPGLILVCFWCVGRFDPPHDRSPAELVRSVRELEESHQWAGALRTVEELLRVFPNSHIYLEQAARFSARLERPNEQAGYLERYISQSPEPGQACPALAHAYWKLQQNEKMLDAAKRCLALEPKNSDFKFDFALANERSGRWLEALSLYRDGAKEFPIYTDFSIGHARLLLQMNRAAEAFEEISPILESTPGLADAELVAGQAALRSGQIERAKEILTKAVATHPTNQELKNALRSALSQSDSR